MLSLYHYQFEKMKYQLSVQKLMLSPVPTIHKELEKTVPMCSLIHDQADDLK